MGDGRLIAVLGATGLRGKEVVRQLAAQGWQVRALTRRPQRKKATRLASGGVDVVRGDMDDPASLERAFSGVEGVFCVQNHRYAGYDGELRQAKIVTDVALRLGVPHVVYSGAGTGRADTGIGSWDTKARIIEHMNDRGLPVTVLRPMAFMEFDDRTQVLPTGHRLARDAEAHGRREAIAMARGGRPGCSRRQSVRKSPDLRRTGPCPGR